jgi:hypothetical protein
MEKTRQEKIETFWKQMTEEEFYELTCRKAMGQQVGNVILWGHNSLMRLYEYQDMLIEKYYDRKTEELPEPKV